MLTALIFIIVLSILVFVHELGHFVMAKRAGMNVEEFGFGFPPRIFGIKRGGTVYSLNWIPFGGFVRILGEDGSERQNPRSFSAQSLWTRIGVIIAGVTMNVILAMVLMVIVNIVGMRVGLTDDAQSALARDRKVQIVEIATGSPAAQANIKILDEITAIGQNGQFTVVTQIEDVKNFVNQHLDQTITLRIREGTQTHDVNLIPRAHPPIGQGSLGIAMALTGIIKYPWQQAFIKAIQYTGIIFANTAIGYATIIKNLFTTGHAGVQLSGPVGIAVITGQAARIGLAYLLQFMALISINLAVLNIIPFPALDGGRLLFLIIEKIKGSPIPQKLEAAINTSAFLLLVILMIYVTTKDILRFF